MSTAPVESGRSARKQRAVLEAAPIVFLQRGYGGTTMDEVAAVAGVSKQTIYQHFADKKGLFTAMITAQIAMAETPTHDLIEALGGSDDLQEDLRRFARQHVADVMQPDLMRLRRIVISEAEQFPELARSWYEHGPERGHAALAAQLETLARRGLLSVEDPLLAAQHLNWLILSVPLNRAMFHGSGTPVARAELRRYADAAVRVFLEGYARRGSTTVGPLGMKRERERERETGRRVQAEPDAP